MSHGGEKPNLDAALDARLASGASGDADHPSELSRIPPLMGRGRGRAEEVFVGMVNTWCRGVEV